MKYFFRTNTVFLFLLIAKLSSGQYTHQDTLRGSITPERAWWDVLKYDIAVKPDYDSKTIKGQVSILFKVVKPGNVMQIDLQAPLIIDSFSLAAHSPSAKDKFWRPNDQSLMKHDGNVWLINLPEGLKNSSTNSITIYYHGSPRIAVNPPWDGGWIFTKDEKGRPWMTVACQGLGASVWYPCKDHQSDEPDNGASLTITIPDTLVAVGNGRMINKKTNDNGTTTWTWEVKNPINNYDIIPYIGKYVTWHEEYMGEKGKLDCNYWVMDYNLEKATKQFDLNVKPMLNCFEHWFGPYPFYEDGYKLVETPHLGMEHQSAVAYGNHYVNGYYVGGGNGRDLSGSGWGMKWDYIIVHESGHEWFGNNITTNDIADMWIHEGFTDYSETLFVECQYGKAAADQYAQGLRRSISNRKPIIGPYGVNKEGSGDMYNKGNNLLHTIRQVINDDSLFRQILRGLNKEFYHKTVDSKDVESYISQKSGKDLSRIFDQYLRTINIPVLEYKINGDALSFRWTNCIAGFDMPVKISSGGTDSWIHPKEEWQEEKGFTQNSPEFDKNFYITIKKVE
ncbi:MAG: M1 family metallopeptidase [Bacteroidota bacterium]|nr:M1 family metallopeptidase [Bacteroidota bacterium]